MLSSGCLDGLRLSCYRAHNSFLGSSSSGKFLSLGLRSSSVRLPPFGGGEELDNFLHGRLKVPLVRLKDLFSLTMSPWLLETSSKLKPHHWLSFSIHPSIIRHLRCRWSSGGGRYSYTRVGSIHSTPGCYMWECP